MKKIYVAHPYNNNEDNKRKVEEYIKEFIKENEDVLYISPIHATGFLYNEVNYRKGMEYCFELMKCCDEVYLCGEWDGSTGCCMEYGYVTALGLPITFK